MYKTIMDKLLALLMLVVCYAVGLLFVLAVLDPVISTWDGSMEKLIILVGFCTFLSGSAIASLVFS